MLKLNVLLLAMGVAQAGSKPETAAGCHKLSAEQCCHYVDGRSRWKGQDCVLVGNVKAPYWDIHRPCQPSKWAKNEDNSLFVGDVLDECAAGFEVKCYLNYCNHHTDLMDAFCNGEHCETAHHARMCKLHWDIYYAGKPKTGHAQAYNPEECPATPTPTGAPTHAPTAKPTGAPTMLPTFEPAYSYSIVQSGTNACKSNGLLDILDPAECTRAAVELKLVRSGTGAAHNQNEGDRPFGCRMQTFGPPMWINRRASSRTPASTVHRVICKASYSIVQSGVNACKSNGLLDILDVAECTRAAVELKLVRSGTGAAHNQNEGDRPFGCRMQTFGPPMWINRRASSRTPASTVHRVICKSSGRRRMDVPELLVFTTEDLEKNLLEMKAPELQLE